MSFFAISRRQYKQYLQESKAWQWLRRQALIRDGYACRLCNSKHRLDVHHRCYPERLGEEGVGDLTTLCRTCHRHHHRSVHWPAWAIIMAVAAENLLLLWFLVSCM